LLLSYILNINLRTTNYQFSDVLAVRQKADIGGEAALSTYHKVGLMLGLTLGWIDIRVRVRVRVNIGFD
jgi:hypothetical protein